MYHYNVRFLPLLRNAIKYYSVEENCAARKRYAHFRGDEVMVRRFFLI